jgi:serine/threonine-protein kinase HSL1 (negative regulator of Swe1 kinase)
MESRYLIMEHVAGGELFEYVAHQRRLDEDLCVFLFRQIVAALLYCHRLQIHHRDLKPENILLEQKTMTVKLVDFGMAALQPTGNYLTTPCGSPHYAAPELLSSKSYDGGQADVWSCGVVLFVMLTGYPPFNFPADPYNYMSEGRKLKALFRAINQADYRLPSALSDEAKDLLSRIFIPEPVKRITMKEIWQHPFIHKYNTLFKFDRLQGMDTLIGPHPRIEEWTRLIPSTIDPELFRNLRTLWHSEKEGALVTRLCNDEYVEPAIVS